MRRRDFLTFLAGGMTLWPLALGAQRKAMPVIGFLSARSAGASASLVAAFHRGLSETGYVEGQTVQIEYRWAEGRYDRLPALAADLVNRKVALIATSGGPSSAQAAKFATAVFALVFTTSREPNMKRLLVGAVAALALSTFTAGARAAPCLIVTLTGTQGGPSVFNGQAGAGTLVRYGDDANDCGAIKLQFDVGRGTNMRLSQIPVAPQELTAIFFTHMHSDHTEGLLDVMFLRWYMKGPKIDIVCSATRHRARALVIAAKSTLPILAMPLFNRGRSPIVAPKTERASPAALPSWPISSPSNPRTSRKSYGHPEPSK